MLNYVLQKIITKSVKEIPNNILQSQVSDSLILDI